MEEGSCRSWVLTSGNPNFPINIRSCIETRWFPRVFLASVEDESHRGRAVAAGAGRVLLPFIKEGSTKGTRLAAQAIAKLLITQNPVVAFPGQRVSYHHMNLARVSDLQLESYQAATLRVWYW